MAKATKEHLRALRLANKIAAELFREGADHLLLAVDGKPLGLGWARGPARDLILRHLEEASKC